MSQVNKVFLEFIAFLAASARNCLDEPPLYGSLRLADAISRLIKLAPQIPGYVDDPSLRELADFIDKGKVTVMKSREEYAKFLDQLVEKTAELAMKSFSE